MLKSVEKIISLSCIVVIAAIMMISVGIVSHKSNAEWQADQATTNCDAIHTANQGSGKSNYTDVVKELNSPFARLVFEF